MNATRSKKSLVSLGIVAMAAAINLSCSTAFAQDAVTHAPAPTAATPVTDSSVAPDGSNSSAVSKDSGPSIFDNPLPIHFTLDVNTYYDDNIFISPVKTNDVVFRISPGLNYTFGTEGESDNYLYLKYVPTVIEYYTNSQQDAVDQNADMVYEHNFQKLHLSLEQGYIHSNDTSIQAGTIVVSNVYSTRFNAHYDYSDKLSIQADVDQTLSYYANPGYSNVYEWSGGAYFLYQVTSKVSLGVGPRVGYDEIAGQPSQEWEQGLLHLTYNATEKLTLHASGGGEVRQFDTNLNDQVTGVFDIGAYWTPFNDTSLNLTGYRRNNPSYSIGGTNFTATGISAGVRQGFLRDFAVGINGGYENDSYTAASLTASGARTDNYYYIHPYFEWTPEKWVSLVAYYQYSRDDSTIPTVNFNDNQVGATVSFKY